MIRLNCSEVIKPSSPVLVCGETVHLNRYWRYQELQLGPLSVRADKPLCRPFLHRTVYTGPFLRFPRISCFNHRASILMVAGVPESQVWAWLFPA